MWAIVRGSSGGGRAMAKPNALSVLVIAGVFELIAWYKDGITGLAASGIVVIFVMWLLYNMGD